MKPEEKSIRVLAEHLTVLPIKIHSQVLFASDLVKVFDANKKFNIGTNLDPAQLIAKLDHRCTLIFITINVQFCLICRVLLSSPLLR